MRFIRKIIVSVVIITALALSLDYAYGFVMRKIYHLRYEETIVSVSKEFGVEASLVAAIIKCESNFSESAVSHAKAKGLMQLTDDTFSLALKNLKETDKDIFKPDDNIRCGVWYLSYINSLEFIKDERSLIASYNAGPNKVKKWLENGAKENSGGLTEIPYTETAKYTDRVERVKQIYEQLYPQLKGE